MLGKRARRRPPMKRTTSMTEFTLDLNNLQQPPSPSDHPGHHLSNGWGGGRSPGAGSRRNSVDSAETSHFLRVCYLCKRRLVHGHDIYMYRGDSAFCSLECRHQQMVEDERNEKCALPAKMKDTAAVPIAAAAAAADGVLPMSVTD